MGQNPALRARGSQTSSAWPRTTVYGHLDAATKAKRPDEPTDADDDD
jgi:hypothetical protein